MKYYWISTPSATCRVDVHDGIIQKSSAPIMKRWIEGEFKYFCFIMKKTWGNRFYFQELKIVNKP